MRTVWKKVLFENHIKTGQQYKVKMPLYVSCEGCLRLVVYQCKVIRIYYAQHGIKMTGEKKSEVSVERISVCNTVDSRYLEIEGTL